MVPPEQGFGTPVVALKLRLGDPVQVWPEVGQLNPLLPK
jgi:hypothetical protein